MNISVYNAFTISIETLCSLTTILGCCCHVFHFIIDQQLKNRAQATIIVLRSQRLLQLVKKVFIGVRKYKYIYIYIYIAYYCSRLELKSSRLGVATCKSVGLCPYYEPTLFCELCYKIYASMCTCSDMPGQKLTPYMHKYPLPTVAIARTHIHTPIQALATTYIYAH